VEGIPDKTDKNPRLNALPLEVDLFVRRPLRKKAGQNDLLVALRVQEMACLEARQPFLF
jgi:hypothetical protein